MQFMIIMRKGLIVGGCSADAICQSSEVVRPPVVLPQYFRAWTYLLQQRISNLLRGITMAIQSPDPFQVTRVFSYQPLTEPDAIRLIVLQPALHDSEKVQCSLIHTTLLHYENDIFDHYTALSYVWGDPTDFQTILIDGVPFSVTVNLYSALRDLRDTTKSLRLWADAICINQVDEYEKGLQVAMMGKIYETAHHTVIYLGSMGPGAENILHHGMMTKSLISASVDVQSTQYQLADLILSKPWFRRVWVLQELVFSRDPRIQLGKQRWRWDYVYRFLKELQEKSEQSDSVEAFASEESRDMIRNLHTGYQTRETVLHGYKLLSEMQLARDKHRGKVAGGDQATLFRLITSRRGLGVTDPRDMIFAHIGFASDGHDRFVKADYSMTCVEVYEDYARSVFETSQNYGILFHVGDPRSPTRLPELASWAPDWSEPKSTTPLVELFPGSKPGSFDEWGPGVSDESNKFHHNFIWIKNPAILACLGHELDCIVLFSAQLLEQDISSEKRAEFMTRFKSIMEDWMEWVESPVTMSKMHYYMESMLGRTESLYCDIYNAWREVIQDERILPNWQTLSHKPSFRMSLPPWELKFCLEFDGIKDHYNGPNSLGSPRIIQYSKSTPRVLTVIDCLIWSIFTGFEGLIKDRRLAQTSNGYISLVPSYAEKGDHIFCVDRHLAELNILCLLRPSPEFFNPTLEGTIRLKFDLARLSQPNDYYDAYYDHTSRERKLDILHGTFVGDCFLDVQDERPSVETLSNMAENSLLKKSMIYAIH